MPTTGRPHRIYESIGAATSPDSILRRELATAYLRLSEVLSSTGDTAEAVSFANKGLALQTAAGGDAPLSAVARRELVATYTRVGDLLSNTGDTNGALDQRRRAVALMEAVSATAPEDLANLRQLAIVYQKLGNSLGNPNYPNVGDPLGGMEQLEKSTEVLERATKLYPNNAMFQKNLAVINSNAADVLLALKKSDEAEARQQKALAAFEQLAAADPSNVVAKNDLAISVYKIAEMLDQRGEYPEAVRQYQRALSIHQALMASDMRTAVLLYGGAATALAAVSVVGAGPRGRQHARVRGARLVAAGRRLRAVDGPRRHHHARASPACSPTRGRATALPELEPGTILFNRLWPLARARGGRRRARLLLPAGPGRRGGLRPAGGAALAQAVGRRGGDRGPRRRGVLDRPQLAVRPAAAAAPPGLRKIEPEPSRAAPVSALARALAQLVQLLPGARVRHLRLA